MSSASGPKPFRFLQVWNTQPAISQVVEEAWKRKVKGEPIQILWQKLKITKAAVKNWNTMKFGSVFEGVCKARSNLEACQMEVQQNPMDVESIQKEFNARMEFESALTNEAVILAQKARIKWVKDLDRNSKFFYQKIKQHRACNNITVLEDGDGVITHDSNIIQERLIDYFRELFTEHDCADIHVSKNFIRKKLSVEDATALEVPITRLEVKQIVFGMGADRAPRPDGFT
ncbi:uncharacterized protein LOC132296405 [Cornus florida]|uniref:uncharacterized protein LOC132296405 n=1 Tax=Cornus florida TaxID=4283 RepID=UPI0028A01B8E|nr:uncharacterized protein LOC132296405 [Cornus florida]